MSTDLLEVGGAFTDARPADTTVARPSPTRRRRTRQRVAEAVAALVVAYCLWRIAINPAMRWDVFADYVVSEPVLVGLRTTVVLAVTSAVLALAIGIVLALMRRSSNRLLRGFSWAYIAAFRSTPLLVQILVWYNLAAFFPSLSIGIPFTDINVSASTNDVITPWLASLLALSLNEGAYMAEIVRGGILSVPPGQVEASLGVGMTRGQAMRHTVLPQTVRVIIPPTVNQVIVLLKATALVSVVGGGDLLSRIQYIYAANFLVLPLLFVATFWYLVLTTITTIGQHSLERRLLGEAERDRLGWGRRFADRLRTNLIVVRRKRAGASS